MATYFWNKEHRRYETAAGLIIGAALLRSYVDEAASNVASEFRNIAAGYQADAFSPGDATAWRAWRDAMKAKLGPVHRAFAAIALGGVLNASAQDWDRVDETIAVQAGYLDAFVSAVFAGEKDGTSEGLLSQSELYGLASYSTFENTVRARELGAGMVSEKRISVQDDRRCQTCEEEAAKSWSPIGTLKPIGESECLVRCRCYFIFSEQTLF